MHCAVPETGWRSFFGCETFRFLHCRLPSCQSFSFHTPTVKLSDNLGLPCEELHLHSSGRDLGASQLASSGDEPVQRASGRPPLCPHPPWSRVTGGTSQPWPIQTGLADVRQEEERKKGRKEGRRKEEDKPWPRPRPRPRKNRTRGREDKRKENTWDGVEWSGTEWNEVERCGEDKSADEWDGTEWMAHAVQCTARSKECDNWHTCVKQTFVGLR